MPRDLKAPNPLRLVAERPSAAEMAVPILWCKGVNMSEAIRIVSEAVAESH